MSLKLKQILEKKLNQNPKPKISIQKKRKIKTIFQNLIKSSTNNLLTYKITKRLKLIKLLNKKYYFNKYFDNLCIRFQNILITPNNNINNKTNNSCNNKKNHLIKPIFKIIKETDNNNNNNNSNNEVDNKIDTTSSTNTFPNKMFIKNNDSYCCNNNFDTKCSLFYNSINNTFFKPSLLSIYKKNDDDLNINNNKRKLSVDFKCTIKESKKQKSVDTIRIKKKFKKDFLNCDYKRVLSSKYTFFFCCNFCCVILCSLLIIDFIIEKKKINHE
jgi:hypothetical protein